MKEESIQTEICIQDNEFILRICDSYEWGKNGTRVDRAHLAIIVNLMKRHISDCLHGKMYSEYPEAQEKERVIEVVSNFSITDDVDKLFSMLNNSKGIKVRILK